MAQEKMKVSRKITLSLIGMTSCLLAGCASLIADNQYHVNITSHEEKQAFVVNDDKGQEIVRGVTPQAVQLFSSRGFFKPAHYTVYPVSNDGSGSGTDTGTKLNGKVSRFYILNVLAYPLGLVGLLVVDPMTGAMYELPKEVKMSKSNPVTNQIKPAAGAANND